jgi:ABC-type branched-subunit amino acid transport system ATPase component
LIKLFEQLEGKFRNLNNTIDRLQSNIESAKNIPEDVKEQLKEKLEKIKTLIAKSIGEVRESVLSILEGDLNKAKSQLSKAEAYTDEARELVAEVVEELNKYMKRKAGTLSGGERQFLAIATALVRKSELLMLDEPTAQLSPKFAEIIFSKIIELRDKLGLTILLVEQNVKRALEISDRAYMLISGKVVFEGKASDLLEHEKFEQYCIGLQ